MPTRTDYVRTYWSVCWKWIFPYPCKKSERVSGWRYNFCKVRVRHWLFFCQYWGCEGNTEYYWSGGCLGVGSTTVYNIEKHFKNQLSESGSCSCNGTPIPSGIISVGQLTIGIVTSASSVGLMSYAQSLYTECTTLIDVIMSGPDHKLAMSCLPLNLTEMFLLTTTMIGIAVAYIGFRAK